MRWARAAVVRRRGGQGRAGLGRDARDRGAGRVGDAGRWVVSGVRCGFGGAAGWGVTRAAVVRGGQGRAGLGRDEGLALVWRWFGGIAETVTSCNSPGTRIGLPGPSRAHQLARWCRFVSIAHREPRQTALQGTFARAMISRKITEDQRPATHGPQSPVSARLGPVKARPYAFLKFTWHPNRPSRALQGTSACAMASI